MTDRRPWIRLAWPLLATLVLGSIQATSASAAAVLESPTQDAAVQAVLVSTSGTLETSWGPRTLIGVANADASGDGIKLGSIAVGQRNDNPWAGILHLQFQFNNGLPSINLDGRVRWLAYNPMESLINPKVATTANEAQLALYPPIFQRMIAHPDWIRTISFGSNNPTMDIALAAQPKTPGDAVVVPEPSTLATFSAALIGMGWHTRRRRATSRV
ncbi:PEP-CTERM sorting domain-containing protein [Isosphaeraceae bacterium EP7]